MKTSNHPDQPSVANTGQAPLYERIEENLLRRIEKGAWQVGQEIPSVREICEEFGVSSITANRALRNLCGNGIIERQRGRGNFLKALPAAAAPPAVRPSKAQKIALITRQWGPLNLFFEGYYSLMAEHLVVRAHELDCDVRMAFLPSEGASGVSSIPKWLGVGIEGIIFFGVSGCCLDAAALVMRHKIPAVFVDSYLEGWPCVVTDHTSAALSICAKLHKTGHRRIAYLGNVGPGNNQTNETDRVVTLAPIARHLGLDLADRTCTRFTGAPAEKELLRRWLTEDKITAIVVSTNASFMIADELLRGEKTLRARMPSFVAFDVWPLNAHADTPRLHGTLTDRTAMGRLAFDWLNELVIKGCLPGEQGGKRVAPVIWQDGETLKPLD